MNTLYTPTELLERQRNLVAAWQRYEACAAFDHFVEFVVCLSSTTEFLINKGISGLMQHAQALEQHALELFGAAHPLERTQIEQLSSKLDVLARQLQQHIERQQMAQERRRTVVEDGLQAEIPGFRSVWLLSERPEKWQGMLVQLGYFGLSASAHGWGEVPPVTDDMPMLLIDAHEVEQGIWRDRVQALRSSFPTCRIVAFAVRSEFSFLQQSLAEGCDLCLLEGTPVHQIVAQLLTLSEAKADDPYRILIVEDSKTATKITQLALNEPGITTHAIDHPDKVLHELAAFKPDLILMDMHMPGCTGVEAARVIRQHNQYLSIPILYLSSETDVALQIEALRLGGDLFLTKPFNPVFLNAIVKSTVERYRALRWSMFRDSLTGLHNHTSTKSALESAMQTMHKQQRPMSVIMIDIDRFKQVNDQYGHPVGDQVIRSMAWMLRRRLRKSDIVGRYGGEEFLVGLPGTDAQQAKQILDRIRDDFGQLQHPNGHGMFQVTFSGGIADSGESLHVEDLIKAADAALYEAKRGGRNQLQCHVPTLGASLA